MPLFGLQKENIYGHKKRYEFILSAIQWHTAKKISQQIRILDIGCGTGQMLTLPLAEAGYNITGVDIDANSINKAKEINRFKSANFVCATLENLTVNGRYDIIICSEVLEHLEEPAKALSIIKGLLKDDGIIIITVPNGFGPFELEKLIIKSIKQLLIFRILKDFGMFILSRLENKKSNEINQISMTNNVKCEHIHFFTLRNFSEIISKYGMKIDKIEKSSFLAGGLSRFLFAQSPLIVNLNVNILPKVLPYFMCSGWYFIIKKMADLL